MTLDFQPWQLQPAPEIIYGDLERTPFTYIEKYLYPCFCFGILTINRPSQLNDLVVTLKQAKEIAIDLEAHSYRTYQGFTCLMQISTRTQDFIVDTLELRHDLHKLNDVFADPKILKVNHYK